MGTTIIRKCTIEGRIYDYLLMNGPCSCREIADGINSQTNGAVLTRTVASVLIRMTGNGMVEKVDHLDRIGYIYRAAEAKA